MTTEENDNHNSEIKPDSQRHVNNISIEGVYDDISHPKPQELTEVLATTELLTEKESFAYAHSQFEGYPHIPQDVDEASDLLQSQGFDTPAAFKSAKQTATEKIADAILICKSIENYQQIVTTPEDCAECGDMVGHPHVSIDRKDESIALCMDCSDLDPDTQPYPHTSISDNEE